MRIEKIFGWGLLIFGIGIIIWTLYFSLQVFKEKKPIFEIFKPKTEKISKVSPKPLSLEEKFQQKISEAFKEAIPIEEIYKFLNLISFSIFCGIFIFGGGQIATLGIKLIKR